MHATVVPHITEADRRSIHVLVERCDRLANTIFKPDRLGGAQLSSYLANLHGLGHIASIRTHAVFVEFAVSLAR